MPHKIDSLLKALWNNLYATIWSFRNIILHGKDSITTRLKESVIENWLVNFKQNCNKWLHYTMYNLVDYELFTMKLWKLATKKEVLKLLDASRLCYLNSTKEEPNQRKLTNFLK